MDPIRKIPKKFTKKFGNKVINRQYFRRKTGLEQMSEQKMRSQSSDCFECLFLLSKKNRVQYS